MRSNQSLKTKKKRRAEERTPTHILVTEELASVVGLLGSVGGESDGLESFAVGVLKGGGNEIASLLDLPLWPSPSPFLQFLSRALKLAHLDVDVVEGEVVLCDSAGRAREKKKKNETKLRTEKKKARLTSHLIGRSEERWTHRVPLASSDPAEVIVAPYCMRVKGCKASQREKKQMKRCRRRVSARLNESSCLTWIVTVFLV